MRPLVQGWGSHFLSSSDFCAVVAVVHLPYIKASAGKASPSSPSQLSDPSQSTDGSSQGIQGSPEEAEAKGSSEGVTGSLEGVKGSPEGAKEYYYVRTYTWTPQFGQQEVVLDICAGKTAGESFIP